MAVGVYRQKLVLIFLILAAFLLACIGALYFEQESFFYGLLVLPLGITVIYLFLFHLELLLYMNLFVMPLSLNLTDIGAGVGVSVPSEIFLAFLCLGAFVRVFDNFKEYKSFLSHPVSLFVFAHLAWMAVTSLTSYDVIVSIKFLIMRSAFVLVFFVFTSEFIRDTKGMKRFFVLYTMGLMIVIAYTLGVHSTDGFSYDSSNRICYPFYNDHTIYAAVIAMIIPVFIAYTNISLIKNRLEKIVFPKYSWLILTVLFIAMFFSYSRAGVLSLIVAFCGWGIIKLKISFKILMSVLMFTTLIGLVFQDDIGDLLNSNESVSGGSVVENLQSTTNVSSDVSNTERINRWNCAVRMFKDRPLFGYGPGTYMFVYGQFQKADERTEISVDDGSLGGAHSEYLKPLSESGLIGMLLFIGIIIYAVRAGLVIIYSERTEEADKMLMTGVLVGFGTYIVHGVVNFFLDTDKSSVLFWGMLAIIVSLDIKYKYANSKIKEPSIGQQLKQ